MAITESLLYTHRSISTGVTILDKECVLVPSQEHSVLHVLQHTMDQIAPYSASFHLPITSATLQTVVSDAFQTLKLPIVCCVFKITVATDAQCFVHQKRGDMYVILMDPGCVWATLVERIVMDVRLTITA